MTNTKTQILDPQLETEILSLLESIERLETYQQNYSDPDTYFAANYQKEFNDKLDLLICINKQLKKLNGALKK